MHIKPHKETHNVLTIICFLFLFQSMATAQNSPEIAKVKNFKLTEVLNNVEFIERGRSSEYIIRVFKLHNGAGSAGSNSGEVSHNLLIAVSEINEAPEQSLFEMGPLLNPVFKEWKEDTEEGLFVIEYGPYDKRVEVTLKVDLWQLKVLSSK